MKYVCAHSTRSSSRALRLSASAAPDVAGGYQTPRLSRSSASDTARQSKIRPEKQPSPSPRPAPKTGSRSKDPQSQFTHNQHKQQNYSPPNPWLLINEQLLGPRTLPLAPSEFELQQLFLTDETGAYQDPLSAALENDPYASIDVNAPPSSPSAADEVTAVLTTVPPSTTDPELERLASAIQAAPDLATLNDLIPQPANPLASSIPGLPPPPSFLLSNLPTPSKPPPSTPFTGPHAVPLITAALLRAAALYSNPNPGPDPPNHPSPPSTKAISSALVGLLQTLPPETLAKPSAATLLLALGRLQHYDEPLITRILLSLQPLLPTLTPAEFSHLIEGLALLRHPTPKPFLTSFFTVSKPRLCDFSAPQLSRMLWGLGSLRDGDLIALGPSCDDWFSACADVLADSSQDLAVVDFVDIAWAAAAVQRPAAVALAASIVERVLDQLSVLPAEELARLLQALGAVQFCPEPELMRALLIQVRRMFPGLEADTLADSLQGLARMGARPNKEWLDEALLRSHTLMGQMKGPQLGACVWAFSRFKRSPYKQWSFDFFACCRAESNTFRPLDIVELVEGISAVKAQPNDETIHHFVGALRSALPVLTKEQMASVARSWRALFRSLPGRPLRELVIEMERRARLQV